MRKKILTLTIAFGLATSVFAQQPPAAGDSKQLPSKVQRLNKAPVSNDILKVKLPHPVEVSLPNGLTMLVLEQHRLPTVSYSLWIKSGTLSDPKDLPGLASFTADLLREGTAKRNSAQIATELDELGAGFAADAAFGSNLTTIQTNGLSQSADKLMDLMSDMVLNASFPADELQKYQRQEGARLYQQRSNPGFLARERFARAVYGDFPASVQSPTTDSLKKATSEALKGFHDKYYAPNNAILAVAGDVTVAQAKELATKYFGGWKNHAIEGTGFGTVGAPAAARVYLVDSPGSVQSNILAGGLSLKRSDPDYIPLVITNRILGGGSAARLFSNLREEKGYTYGVYSDFSALRYAGPWRAGGNLRTEVTQGALTEFFNEIRRIQDEKVPAAELEASKRSIVASFALSLEQPARVLSFAIAIKLYGLPADYWDAYPAKIMAVSADDVQRVARKYLNPDSLQVVAVGDADKIKPILEQYGKVEVFDANGVPLGAKP